MVSFRQSACHGASICHRVAFAKYQASRFEFRLAAESEGTSVSNPAVHPIPRQLTPPSTRWTNAVTASPRGCAAPPRTARLDCKQRRVYLVLTGGKCYFEWPAAVEHDLLFSVFDTGNGRSPAGSIPGVCLAVAFSGGEWYTCGNSPGSPHLVSVIRRAPESRGRSQTRNLKRCEQTTSEGKRMASGHTGNVVPRKGLRVRIPCPPL